MTDHNDFHFHETDIDEFDAFDKELRTTAHELREQMQPADDVVQETRRVLAETPQVDVSLESTPPPPTGKPVEPATQTQAKKKRRRNRTIGIFAAAAATVLVVVGGIGIASTLAPLPNTDVPNATENALAAGEIVTPASYEDLFASLEERVVSQESTNGSWLLDEIAPSAEVPATGGDSTAESMDAAPLATEDTSAKSESVASGDFSQTNTQVEGVDEADIVKTDGEYIYALFDYEVIIYRADGTDTKEVSRITTFSGVDFNPPTDMYVVDDRLILMASTLNYTYTKVYSSATVSHASIYDISDPAEPEFIKMYGQDGDLSSSRLVDSTLYMVSVYRIYDYEGWDAENPETFVPRTYEDTEEEFSLSTENSEAFATSDIRILPEYNSVCYSIVTAIDVDKVERLSELSVLGDTSTVYMNEENLFLAAPKYDYNVPIRPLEGEDPDNPKPEPRIPLLPWDQLAFVLDPEGWMAGEYDGSDEVTTDMTMPSGTTYEVTTRVMRLALNDGHPELSADAIVEGTLLNQFSLDEYDGYLRMAMTVTNDVYYEDTDGNEVWAGGETANSLYILDKNLTIVGTIEDLAKGEQIYSARFSGEVGYMVTFRQVDPLFSLDLSDPRNPKVMDELKIPGFSQYLHPYSEGLLLGLGQDTTNRGTTTGNLKLSMFDVSDPFDISEQDKHLIPSYYSEALYNHKAVLIDKDKNIIGFEVELEYSPEELSKRNSYETRSCYMIFGYNEDTGFSERAVIELPSVYAQTRALYIDNYLYLVCGDTIGVYTLDKLEEVIWIND